MNFLWVGSDIIIGIKNMEYTSQEQQTKFFSNVNEFIYQSKRVLELLLNKFSLKLIRNQMELDTFVEIMRKELNLMLHGKHSRIENKSYLISDIDEIKILHKIRDYGGRTLFRLIEIDGFKCFNNNSIDPIVESTHCILKRLLENKSLVGD